MTNNTGNREYVVTLYNKAINEANKVIHSEENLERMANTPKRTGYISAAVLISITINVGVAIALVLFLGLK